MVAFAQFPECFNLFFKFATVADEVSAKAVESGFRGLFILSVQTPQCVFVLVAELEAFVRIFEN